MKNLQKKRNKLTEYFESLALRENLRISPRTDIIQLNLLDRLYEEYVADRGIIIELVDPRSNISFDYFLKETERNDQRVFILYLSVASLDQSLSKLWSMYYDWLHQHEPYSGMEAKFAIERRASTT